MNENLISFVTRCYTKALGRTYDVNGLNYWTMMIQDGKCSAKQVAVNFIQSQEFKDKNLSDEEYIKVLYRTYFDREFDESGLTYWKEKLAGGELNRDEILMCFADSEEFAVVIASFGL